MAKSVKVIELIPGTTLAWGDRLKLGLKLGVAIIAAVGEGGARADEQQQYEYEGTRSERTPARRSHASWVDRFVHVLT